jgi:hypothetical protein
MSNNVATFLTNLKGVIEGIDTSIGFVYETKKKWLKVAEMEGDVKLTISASGILDAAARVGQNVVRFWMMSPAVTPRPLTNKSTEYRTVVTIMGFFQREDDDSQEAALRTAALALLDQLNLKVTELTTLDVGSDGYMGYLDQPPTVGDVQNAVLDDSGLVGHAVQMTVTYFEEVSR